jgi:hypothetical protein
MFDTILAPEPSRSVLYTRQDYRALEVEALGTSPAGDVYLALHSGSRSQAIPVLCRWSLTAEPSCVALPREIEIDDKQQQVFGEIVARDHGVIFMRAGQKLLRFQYPD